MGKKDKTSSKPDASGKKRKHDKVAAAAPAAAGFSLFGKSQADSGLNDIFAKAAALSQSSAPAAAPTAAAVAAAPVAEEGKRKKARKSVEAVKEAEVEVEEIEVEEKEEESETAEEEVDSEENVEEESEAEEDSEDDAPVDLTHESLKTSSERKQRANVGTQKYTPSDETSVDRDRRTAFIGNVALEAIKSKSVQSQLRQHLLKFAPSAKIESIRFRSLAFSTPTAALPGEVVGEAGAKDANQRAQREKERAAAWRAQQLDGKSSVGGAANRRGDDEVADKSKSFLDSKGKRKVAFIKQDFHSDASSCNAYVVFAHPHPDRPTNVAPILNPFEAVDKVLAANGSVFMERTLRVDRLRLPSAVALATATNALSKRDAWLPSGTDPKQSLFVGGLDYAAKDEDVRAFFESLVVAERGKPYEKGFEHWVTSVRIIRDKDTQLGKGFGYVHFADRESADEIISLPSNKLKFAKKPLRVQPSKTLPPKAANSRLAAVASGSGSAPGPKGAAGTSGSKPAAPKRAAPTGPIPRGNPKLGEKIKDLSKEERKAVKSTDADRQARRMAKKQHKVANAHKETGAVKLAATKAEKGRRDKKVKAKVGRVRSSNALKNMKGKRA